MARVHHSIFNSLLYCAFVLSPLFSGPPSQLARAPSAVRNFTVIVNFDVSRSMIIANLSWIGPERPYGKIDHYKIVLSSAKAASLIGSKTLDVQVCIDVPTPTLPTGNSIHDHLVC